MKIGIDARSLRREGVGRYIRDLVSHLPKVAPEHDYHVYLPRAESVDGLQLDSPCMQFHRALPTPWFQRQVARDRLDLYHATDHWYIPLPKPCRLVPTFHDLMVRTYPQALSLKARVYSRLITPVCVAVADRIITVSRFNEREILRYYPGAMGKIAVIPHGIHPSFGPQHDPEVLRRIRERNGIRARYFLFVGSLKKHKNVPRLLQAFALLPERLRSTLTLVIAARMEPQFSGIVQKVQDHGIGGAVKFVGYLPPEELAPLYRGAVAFITVSLYESFCYPVVEAMACGTPVIAPNHLALPEVTQGAALLVNPLDPTAIREAMERVATGEQLRADLIQKGLRRARDFTCQATAGRVAKVYHEVLSR